MSSYRMISPTTIMAAGVMTGTAVITSAVLDILSLVNVAFQLKWTGTPNGTFSVQGSQDNVTFNDIGATISPAVGSADSRLINISGVAFRYIQVVYTNTSSTGVLTIIGSAKGI